MIWLKMRDMVHKHKTPSSQVHTGQPLILHFIDMNNGLGGDKVMTTALELSHLRCQNLHPVLTSPLHSLKPAPSLLLLALTSFNCSAICPQTWNEGLSGEQHHSLQAQCREFEGSSPERGLHVLPWTVVRSLPPILVACMSDN